MNAFLEAFAGLPGVEFVLLISHDGVPIAHASGAAGSEREESLAALAASWLNDVSMAVAPLSWDAPRRICLRAGRGTIVVRRSESACLVVLLGRETSPEDVRLSMDGALARIERARHGRAMSGSAANTNGSDGTAASSEPSGSAQAPGPIPYRPDPSAVEEGVRPASHPGNPPGT